MATSRRRNSINFDNRMQNAIPKKKKKRLDNDSLVIHFKQQGNCIQGLVVVVFLVVLVDLVFSVVDADRYLKLGKLEFKARRKC